MKTDFCFKGMMVPVFTPFMDDKTRSINMNMVDKYCQYMKSMGMQGVAINTITGEGMCMTMQERMQMTEKWHEATRKHGMTMMVNIGGTDLPSVYMMAEHCEKMQVDCVMIMPDMCYKPMTEEDLMMYMKDVMKHCPTRPMMYYHMPMMTGVHMDMMRMMKMMERECPMFAGVYYCHDNMDMMMMCKQMMPHMNMICGTMSSMMACMSQGMEAMSMAAMNVCPEMIKQMYDHMMNHKMNEAKMIHEKMMKYIYDMFHMDADTHMNMDYMMMMRMQMDKMQPMGIKMGPMRRPHMTMDRMFRMNM
ncbi:N-acetylneuraminate lyase B-like [Contarinia nasturtii]|uniref:N-acetylneuraminate lyase B-like n=1 Tax=Contarinia nasturtii TaxID=265458 RepID=UPI0012D4C132|nr:N-acetylneuraminate lyase B-like [Contarinia nasturtii]